jgi:molybdopterin synthase sulfur carrier subunit
MPIPVRLPSALAAQAGGNRKLDAEGATVGAVLDHIVERFPSVGPRLRDAAGELYPFVTVYLNDQDIRFSEGFATAVTDGDEVVIVPAVAGG